MQTGSVKWFERGFGGAGSMAGSRWFVRETMWLEGGCQGSGRPFCGRYGLASWSDSLVEKGLPVSRVPE